MKDLGFNEYGEPVNYGAQDEEALSKAVKKQIELTSVEQSMEDEDAEEEAENTEIAI